MSSILDSLPTVGFFDHKELGLCLQVRFDFSNSGFAILDMIAATAREFADRIYTIADAIDKSSDFAISSARDDAVREFAE